MHEHLQIYIKIDFFECVFDAILKMDICYRWKG